MIVSMFSMYFVGIVYKAITSVIVFWMMQLMPLLVSLDTQSIHW